MITFRVKGRACSWQAIPGGGRWEGGEGGIYDISHNCVFLFLKSHVGNSWLFLRFPNAEGVKYHGALEGEGHVGLACGDPPSDGGPWGTVGHTTWHTAELNKCLLKGQA